MTDQQADPFIEFLRGLEPGGRATLRRSLAFPPGTWPAAFPYIEPWVRNRSIWQRKVAYLVAGLEALSRTAPSEGDLGMAAAKLHAVTGSASLENRFIALLDADPEQLPHRLRQMVTLMSAHDVAPSWSRLRRDLEHWRHPDRVVQQRWARSFYAQLVRGEDAEAAGGGEPGAPADASGEIHPKGGT